MGATFLCRPRKNHEDDDRRMLVVCCPGFLVVLCRRALIVLQPLPLMHEWPKDVYLSLLLADMDQMLHLCDVMSDLALI